MKPDSLRMAKTIVDVCESEVLVEARTSTDNNNEQQLSSNYDNLSSRVDKTPLYNETHELKPKKKRVTFKLDEYREENVVGGYIWEEENSMRFNLGNCVQLLNERLSKNSIFVFACIALNQLLLSSFSNVTNFTSAVVTVTIGVASFGASFGLRKMYVKALLKIFEYATNIKEEKLKICEDLLDREITNQLEKDKEIEKLKTLRLESFQLNPRPSSSNLHHHHHHHHHHHNHHIDGEDAVETGPDEPNNNYISVQGKDRAERSHLDSGLDSPSSVSSSSTDLHQSYSEADLAAKNAAAEHLKKNFQLHDIIDFVQNGMDAIIDDEVTKRFTTEELTVWNLLSRTNQQYEYVSFRVTVLWLVGLILRYCVLFPFRLVLFILACFYTFVSTFLIGLVPDSPIKRRLNWYGSLILHRMLSRVFSAIITFHQRENRAKSGSICVANHTSPIDVIILSTDNCYSMIGQEHGGFTGMMQRAFSRASNHIWFDRSEARDRSLVARRMRQHVETKDNLPILIFPEGTCINNTSVMMFKKGCFEVDTAICPVAIKYDLRFGDAFWNSAKHSMLQYLMLMMTSWAIVVDVYYLPTMHRHPDEDAAEFASRVKSAIAKKGGFVDLNWDGMLKRTTPKLDLMYEQQQKYVSQLKID